MEIGITVYDEMLKYQLVLNSNNKISIIRGNSGTGKTTLCEMIQQFNLKQIGVELECSRKCIVIDTFNYDYLKGIIRDNAGAILFFDEDTVELYCSLHDKDNPLPNILMNADNYFVVITRRNLLWMPVSISAMYKLKSTVSVNGITVTRLVPMHEEKLVASNENVVIDKIITEDSKSGNIIMTRYFDCKVMTTYGKDNIIKCIERDTTDNIVLIVLDACKYGWSIDRLAEACRMSGRKYYLFKPDSIEGYILRSPLLKCDTDVEKPIYNIEIYLEKLLKSKLPLGYSKSSTSDCILNECNCNRKCKNCLYVTNRKKRDMIIYGELEVLEPKKY